MLNSFIASFIKINIIKKIKKLKRLKRNIIK